MIPVFLFDQKGPHGYNIKNFEERVIDICEEHQNEKRACAFAFILHDAESPQYSKVLKDQDYWDSLNSISGKALTVFSVFSGLLRRDEGNSFANTITSAKSHREQQRRIIQTYFGVDDIAFPALLFFQVSNGMVSGMTLISLKARDMESAYAELSDLLRMAAEAVRDSTGKLIQDPERAFSKIKTAVRYRATVVAGKELGKTASAIKSWLAFLIG